MSKLSEERGAESRALVISPEAPYPPVGGGPLRTASLLEYLLPRYRVDLIVFREPGAPDPRLALPAGKFHRVHVIALPSHSRGAVARLARNLRRLARKRPPLNDRFSGFAPAIRELLEGNRYELAVIEHFWCAPYAEFLRPYARRLVLDLHNVESELYARLAASEPWPLRPVFRRFARCCRRMEERWLPEFDLILAASGEDTARVLSIAPGLTAAVYPNAIPVVPQPCVAEQEVVAFSGNLEYQPNAGAVRYFRRAIWPALREQRPGLVWRVIGRNPHAVERYLRGDERIELVGPVADAIHELAAAKVVVAPLLAASGTRVKILEAWAAGRAVVSTSSGAEGLGARHGEHLLLADRPADFVRAILELLDSPERRRALGEAGRARYQRYFSWPAAWRQLEAVGI
ncbi:MAG: glycosyltransferase family 4 protein [Bryobacteraceae bacterium]